MAQYGNMKTKSKNDNFRNYITMVLYGNMKALTTKLIIYKFLIPSKAIKIQKYFKMKNKSFLRIHDT